MATDYNYRKSGQIPAFGDWENANDMPITQYFDCARQAGLLRCSCSGECGGGGADVYGAGFQKAALPRRVYAVPQRKPSNKSFQHSMEQRKQVKVRDVLDHHPRNQKNHSKHNSSKSGNMISDKPSITVKPVDEDLYKIPSELLENSKRKKVLGFFSRCMVPPCAA